MKRGSRSQLVCENRVRRGLPDEHHDMPQITYDARSLLINGRRSAISGAGVEYVAMDPSLRSSILRSFSSLGFNTLLASCPWHLHEPVPGGYVFDGRLDVAEFCREADALGLRTILRVGPAVGAPFDGGGIPTWMSDLPAVEARSGSPEFLELVSRWFAQLADRLVDLQADRDGGGPLIAIQVEHDWQCGSEDSGAAYMRELVRYARERGFTVPILTANGFWSQTEGAVETWTGWDDLFTNVRQMASIQPDMPRICVIDRGGASNAFHRPGIAGLTIDPDDLADRFARVVAAGGQPIVAHAFEGQFPAGATGRDAHGEISPTPYPSALVDGLGRPTDQGRKVARIARFVRDFGPTVADLDPEDQPLVRDLDDPSPGPIIVSRCGGVGELMLAFDRGGTGRVDLIDRAGRRIPLDFDEHRVTWRIFEADLAGRGRLDFASATPMAFLAGRLIVLSAAAGSRVELSIDDRPIDMTTPKPGRRWSPSIEVDDDFTIVLLDEASASTLMEDVGPDGSVSILLGAAHVRRDGSVEPLADGPLVRIDADGTVSTPSTSESSSPRNRRAKGWSTWSEPDPRDPDHPRSIPVDGDLGLATMGAGLDHAWFTANLRLPDDKKRTLRLLGGLADAQVWIDDESLGRFVDGEIPFDGGGGDRRIALFAGHRPRRVEGLRAPADGDRPGALVSVKPLTGVTRSTVDHPPMDPFEVASFIPGAADGELTAPSGIELAFVHRRKSSLILEIDRGSAGVIVLNGEPIGTFGREGARVVLGKSESEHFKSGGNRLLILPLEHVAEEGVETEIELVEVAEELVSPDAWRVRRFDPAPDLRIGHWNGAPAKSFAGPHWVKAVIPVSSRIRKEIPESGATIRLEGLTRGRIRVNGVDLGGYALRAPGERLTRKTVVPEISVPGSILADEPGIEVEIFDEGGADPSKVVVRF